MRKLWTDPAAPTTDSGYSTMARNFSASLNDAFAINDNSLDGLLQSVERKSAFDRFQSI